MVNEEGDQELGIWTSTELDDLRKKEHREKERGKESLVFIFLEIGCNTSAPFRISLICRKIVVFLLKCWEPGKWGFGVSLQWLALGEFSGNHFYVGNCCISFILELEIVLVFTSFFC